MTRSSGQAHSISTQGKIVSLRQADMETPQIPPSENPTQDSSCRHPRTFLLPHLATSREERHNHKGDATPYKVYHKPRPPSDFLPPLVGFLVIPLHLVPMLQEYLLELCTFFWCPCWSGSLGIVLELLEVLLNPTWYIAVFCIIGVVF